jgi:hypothetical protein
MDFVDEEYNSELPIMMRNNWSDFRYIYVIVVF